VVIAQAIVDYIAPTVIQALEDAGSAVWGFLSGLFS
jgi:hypothetical protein